MACPFSDTQKNQGSLPSNEVCAGGALVFPVEHTAEPFVPQQNALQELQLPKAGNLAVSR